VASDEFCLARSRKSNYTAYVINDLPVVLIPLVSSFATPILGEAKPPVFLLYFSFPRTIQPVSACMSFKHEVFHPSDLLEILYTLTYRILQHFDLRLSDLARYSTHCSKSFFFSKYIDSIPGFCQSAY